MRNCRLAATFCEVLWTESFGLCCNLAALSLFNVHVCKRLLRELFYQDVRLSSLVVANPWKRKLVVQICLSSVDNMNIAHLIGILWDLSCSFLFLLTTIICFPYIACNWPGLLLFPASKMFLVRSTFYCTWCCIFSWPLLDNLYTCVIYMTVCFSLLLASWWEAALQCDDCNMLTACITAAL